MKIIVKQKFYKANVGKLRKEIFNNMQILWRNAIRAFLEGVLSKIQVDTGMAKASLRPLAAEVGMDLSISPKRGPRKGLDTFTVYYPDRYKGIEEGTRLGEKAFHIGWGTANNPQLYFRFNITVFHYWLHETGLASHPSITGAWKSLNAGESAMRRYLDQNAIKIVPSLSKWMKPSSKIGG